jgi:YidC/Oxa1 family membrane protein insertase
MNTRSIQSKANVSSANRELELEKANAAKANAKPGSMAAKANLVKEFREKNNRK